MIQTLLTVEDVADVDLPDAGNAGDWRRQARVAELNFGFVDLRLIRLDGGL